MLTTSATVSVQTLTYPLELFVCRHCVHALVFPSDKKVSDAQVRPACVSALTLCFDSVFKQVLIRLSRMTQLVSLLPLQHYTITMLLWGSSLAIALNVTDLGVVLELTGKCNKA
jgi:hypothetical protein